MRMDGLLSSSSLLRAIVLGLLLVNVGCNAANGWAMNRSGMKQYQRGNYAQARHQFARAIADDQCNPDYRHNLAMALQKQGDAASAERILRHNLTVDAMHQPSYHALAQILTSEGRTGEAQDLIAGWAETQPYVPEANVELAWLQRESGNTAGAEQSLRNALRANPTHPTALAQLGQLYQESGRSDQAVAYYQRSLTAKWDQPEVQSRLATLTEPANGNRVSRRSAMMQNPASQPMMASNGPMMMTSPGMATNAPFGTDTQVIALEGVNSNPQPRVSRRGRGQQDGTVITAYPLPSFDSPMMAGLPAGMTPGQPEIVFQQPIIAAQPMMAPQMAESTYASNPMVASAPPLIPQFDPAHSQEPSPEMTALTPVVDPH
jgi:Tfp pilus assembly protein PilF